MAGLKDGGNIVCGNAAQVNWQNVCPNNGEGEVFILGNPPYLGSKVQKKNHKEDIKLVFNGFKKYKDLDYIGCWFKKASDYIKGSSSKFAFVSTNSICQGTQVEMLWPYILENELEIEFCHQPFKWTNNAKSNAGVTCIIVGIRNISSKPKHIYEENYNTVVRNINPYLAPSSNIIVSRRSRPFIDVPKMDLGNMPIDGGNLILSPTEKDELVKKYPEISKILRPLYGSNEFIKGTKRYCIWIEDEDLAFAKEFKEIRDRIDNVYKKRIESTDAGTRRLADRPYQFREMKHARDHLLLVCRVSSERREYIPMGILSSDCIIADAQVIYDPQLSLFGFLTSKMHMLWIKSVCGQLESRIRYSSAIGYNTFPFPNTSNRDLELLEQAVQNLIIAREKFSNLSIEKMYDPNKMPTEIREAHNKIDSIVESFYKKTGFVRIIFILSI